jgi:hypothetical protein
VLAADPREDALPDQVGAELGQGPAAVRQAEVVRGRLGQPPDGADLGVVEARRGARAARLANRAQPQALEGAQVGVGGVDVNPQEAGDVGCGHPGGVEHQGLGPATLPGPQRGFEQAMDRAELVATGPGNGGGARHGRTSCGDEIPPFYQTLGDKFGQALCDTTVN